jgi:hypothetical protein
VADGRLLRAAEAVRKAAANPAERGALLEFFEGKLSLRTLRNISADRVGRAHQSTKTALIEYLEYREGASLPYTEIYNAISSLFKLEIHERIPGRFAGEYNCFRLANDGNIITGEIRIFFENNTCQFEHHSKQDVHDQIREFNHRGIVIFLDDRIYLIGLGSDAYGHYLRPMILRKVQFPDRDPIVGIVLLEALANPADDSIIPLASKTVLIRRGATWDTDPNIVRSYLRNESETENIVYGWSKRPTSLKSREAKPSTQ